MTTSKRQDTAYELADTVRGFIMNSCYGAERFDKECSWYSCAARANRLTGGVRRALEQMMREPDHDD